MATVTGFTAARMAVIEGLSIISGVVQSDHLILERRDGTTVDAGNVRGPQGIQGPPGSITSSPAGGSLSGSYPNPGLADGSVTDAKVAAANKDGAAGTASMRTLGTNPTQAAAGNHSHGDTGWVDVVPAGSGDAPFGTRIPVYLQYRKRGALVHVRFRKDSAGSIDRSGNAGGNFPNVKVFPPGTIPTLACPDSHSVQGQATLVDSPQGLLLNTDGSVSWTGGFARVYNAGSSMVADFVFYTDN